MYQRTYKDRIARHIAEFGALLALFGFVSSVVSLFGYELRILLWIDRWGPVVAWVIRGSLIVGGMAISVIAYSFDASEGPEAEEGRRQEREAMMRHPRTVQVTADMAREARVVWEPSGTPGEYVIRKVVWLDGQHRWRIDGQDRMYGPDDPQVTSVAVYVESVNPPRRLMYAQDLTTRRSAWQDVHPDAWAFVLNN